MMYVAIALQQQRQEGIMDLDQVDSGDIEGAYIPTGLGSSRAEYLDPDVDVELTQYQCSDWKAATERSCS